LPATVFVPFSYRFLTVFYSGLATLKFKAQGFKLDFSIGPHSHSLFGERRDGKNKKHSAIKKSVVVLLPSRTRLADVLRRLHIDTKRSYSVASN